MNRAPGSFNSQVNVEHKACYLFFCVFTLVLAYKRVIFKKRFGATCHKSFFLRDNCHIKHHPVHTNMASIYKRLLPHWLILHVRNDSTTLVLSLRYLWNCKSVALGADTANNKEVGFYWCIINEKHHIVNKTKCLTAAGCNLIPK